MDFGNTEFDAFEGSDFKARMAFELFESGEISQALAALDDAIEQDPSNSSWHFDKALTLDSIERFDEAIHEYGLALELNPCDLEILNSLAVDYTRTGQYDLALETFEYIQQLDSQFEPCYCNRIITYTETEQHDLAEEMFYLAQQVTPDCALCYYNIGNSLFARGQYKKAIHCWLKTAEFESTHPQINYRIAQAHLLDGSLEQAHEYFLAELRINPGDVDVILDFGLFLLESGRIESAKEKFNRILELNPNFAPAFFYLGEIAFNSGDYPEAVRLFNKSLTKDDRLAGPRYRLAQYSLMLGNDDEAKAYLLSEMQLAQEDADALVSIGSIFLTLKMFGLSENCFLRAIELDRINCDAYYYLGITNAENESFDGAIEFFNHVLDIQPEHVGALTDSALVYLAQDRLAESCEMLKRVLFLEKNLRLKLLYGKIKLIQAVRWFGRFLRRSKS